MTPLISLITQLQQPTRVTKFFHISPLASRLPEDDKTEDTKHPEDNRETPEDNRGTPKDNRGTPEDNRGTPEDIRGPCLLYTSPSPRD